MAPERTCVGCRQPGRRDQLLRFVLDGGRPVPDPARAAPGRGAWLHDDPQCRAAAERRGGLDRALRRPAAR